MNIFVHELKAYRKSTVIWTMSIVAVSAILLLMLPAITEDAEQFKKVLDSYPEAIREGMGITVDSFTSFLGFYSFVIVYILVCGSMQAMNYGTSVLSKETREKTADFLLTKPITRSQVVTAKLLAIITSLVVTNVVYCIFTRIMASSITDEAIDTKLFLLISLSVFFVQLMFMSLGMLISVMMSKVRSVLPISLSVVFGLFIVGMIFGKEESVRYITPFKYFEPSYIIKNGSYELSFLIVSIVFVVVSTAMSYVLYNKKDVHAV